MLIQADSNLLLLLQDMGVVARAVLVILAIASIWSWGIILSKGLHLRKAARESEVFWKMFRKGQSLSAISTACEALRFTPLAPVLHSAVELLEPRAARSIGPVGGSGTTVAVARKPTSPAALTRTMQRAAAAQLSALESRLTFLATTAAVAPFVGLFGTVWGVLTAFNSLRTGGAATLQAVAPGIAEALVTTAFGLFTAIPAVVFYNQFVQKIRNIGVQLDDLQAELLAITDGDDT